MEGPLKRRKIFYVALCLYTLSFVLFATVLGRVLSRHKQTSLDYYCPDPQWETVEPIKWSGVGFPAFDFPEAIDVGCKFLENRYLNKVWVLHSASLSKEIPAEVWSYRFVFLANDGNFSISHRATIDKEFSQPYNFCRRS